MKASVAVIFLAIVTFLGAGAAGEIVSYQNEKDTFNERFNAYIDTRDPLAAIATGLYPSIPEGMGFMWPGNPSVPREVSAAAESSFEIAIPTGKPSFTKDPRRLLNAVRKEVIGEDFTQFQKDLIIAQIETCLRLKTLPCAYYKASLMGSAFVTGDGKDLRTALHVVEPLALKALRNPSDKSWLPLYLFKEGRLVARAEDLKARFYGLTPAALKSLAQDENLNLDQALLKVDVVLAKPLKEAQSPPRTGEAVFLIAHPKSTDDRQKYFNATDSDGRSVSISRGSVLNSDGVTERARLNGVPENPEGVQSVLENALAFTADGAPKASGGAILNERGEVVGIYDKGFPRTGYANKYRISFGTRMLMH